VNRRIRPLFETQRAANRAERIATGALVFLAVLAFVALLGVDDFETEPPRPNTWEMTEP
jgi:hypothetical protein